jgi:hypothetical protein
MLCEYKLRKVTVFSYDEEIARQEEPIFTAWRNLSGSSEYDILSNVTVVICYFYLCKYNIHEIWCFLLFAQISRSSLNLIHTVVMMTERPSTTTEDIYTPPCPRIHWFRIRGLPRPEKKTGKLKKQSVHKFQNERQARTCRNMVKSSSPNAPSTWLIFLSPRTQISSILLLAFSLFAFGAALLQYLWWKSPYLP